MGSGSITKVKRKELLQDCKRSLKETWSIESDNSDEKTIYELDIPSTFRKYTIEAKMIKLKKLVHHKPKASKFSYKGFEDTKQVDLAN